MDIQIFITGPAGSGVKFLGKILQDILSRFLYTFLINGYYSVIKGGRNYIQLRVSDTQIASQHSKNHIYIALNKDTLLGYIHKLYPNALLIIEKELYDSLNAPEKHELTRWTSNIITIELKHKLIEHKLSPMFYNTALVGLICSILKADHLKCSKILQEKLQSRFPQNIVDMNIKAFDTGFKQAEQYALSKIHPRIYRRILNNVKIHNRLKRKNTIISDAAYTTALGFIAAEGKIYTAYPMTPSTPILHYLARLKQAHNIIVRQASTEIEALGVALGAQYAGARAATATSGGGLDLMGEFISMSGMAEIPAVIINAQRVGPSTGLPTWHEQSDLNLVLNIGHGEFPRIVLAPKDPQDAYTSIQEAFNLADIYQIPVFILLDKYLTTSRWQFSKEAITTRLPIERGKIIKKPKSDDNGYFPRYRFTTDGVSPRTLPGTPEGIHVANSDEHDIYGFSIESSPERVVQHSKRLLKLQTILKNHFKMPAIKRVNKKRSYNAVLSWGSTYHTIAEAIQILNTQYGQHLTHIHFNWMYPLDFSRLKRVFAPYNSIILIEQNATAQLEQLLAPLQLNIKRRLLKFDGEPFFVDEIVNALKRIKS